VTDDAFSKRMSEGTRNAPALAATLPGLDEDEAKSQVAEAGCVWRVTARDGESFPVTADLRPYRINVTIAVGRVVSAEVY
jgi:hypothetical protein